MLKLLSRKTNAEKLEIEFNEIVSLLDKADANTRVAVGYGINVLWQAFNARFNSIEEFQKQNHGFKIDYLKSISTFESLVRNEQSDKEVALGASLFKMFLAPVIDGNQKMVNRMVEKLEPLNAEGWSFAKIR